MKRLLYNVNNMDFETEEKFDVIFADYIYEDRNFSWINKYWEYLKPNGVFIGMTDFHSSAEYKVYL